MMRTVNGNVQQKLQPQCVQIAMAEVSGMSRVSIRTSVHVSMPCACMVSSSSLLVCANHI